MTTFQKLSDKAVVPQQPRSGDVGIDLWLCDHKKTLKETDAPNDNIVYFMTDLAVKPPPGYYYELLPRSSFHKTGWALANNVGVIDPAYRGNIIAACHKLYPEAEIPELPCKAVQLVLRKMCIPTTVDLVEQLDNTTRGEGGFGSTNKPVITVGDICYETEPCQYDVTMNGVTKKMFKDDIIDVLFKHGLPLPEYF